METLEQNHNFKAILFAALGVVLFSAKAIFVKMAYVHHVDTVSLILLRMLFALPVYLLIVVLSFRKWKRVYPMNKKHILFLIVLGVLGYYFASYLDFAGLKFISASMERLVLFVYPTMVVLITALLYRKPIPQKHIIAIIVTYFGIFLTFYQTVFIQQSQGAITGFVLILSCAFSYACFLVGSGKLIPIIGAVQFTCYAMIVATITVVCHFLLKSNPNLLEHPAEVYWIGGAMAIVSTVLPSFLIAAAIKQLGASKVAIIGSIGPVSTIIMASIVLGEKITAFQALGALIVISGVMLITTGNKKLINRDKNSDIEKPSARIAYKYTDEKK